MLNINTEIRKTSINKLKALYDLSVEIKKEFAESKERVNGEIANYLQRIEQQKKVISDTYSQYTLDLKSLAEYQQEQLKLQELTDALEIIKSKLRNLDTAQKTKINTEVYQPMKALSEDANKEKSKIYAEKRKAIFTAKAEYLKAINENAYDLILLESVTSDCPKRVEVDAGLKKLLYTEGAVTPMLHKLVYSDSYNGGNPIVTVTEQEVARVFTTTNVAG